MSATASCFGGLLAGVDFKWRGYNSHSSLTMNHNSPLEARLPLRIGWGEGKGEVSNSAGSKASNSSASRSPTKAAQPTNINLPATLNLQLSTLNQFKPFEKGLGFSLRVLRAGKPRQIS